MSGTLAAIFGLPGSKKWIALEGRAGISRKGSGAPTASGAKKSLALRMGRTLAAARAVGYDASHGVQEEVTGGCPGHCSALSGRAGMPGPRGRVARDG